MLYLDLETYSETPIKHGAYKYAEDAEILLCGYAINDEPAKVWDVTKGEPMPADLRDALVKVCDKEEHIVMHNGMSFDRLVIKSVWGYDIPHSMVEDTMVMAYQCALPGALADLCAVFGLGADEAKDKDGSRLINLFSTPTPKNYKIPRATRLTHPEDWAKFIDYCRQDIVAMRILYKDCLPKFNRTGQEKQYEDVSAIINDRGFLIDMELVDGALAIANNTTAVLNQKAIELTNGALASVNQRQALVNYLNQTYGLNIETLRRTDVDRYLDDDTIPEEAKALLRLRKDGAKTSVSKYVVLKNGANADHRLRGTLQFRGATRTGRYAGRLFQPQNLPRPSVKEHAEIDDMIAMIKNGALPYFYDDLNLALSDCIRGCIVAPIDKKLLVADYSNIEGRVLSWLAGEDWKIQAFKDADEGRGADLYKLAFGRTFGKDPADVTPIERQVGKVLELSMGYGGGVGAFATFASAYRIDLDRMADNVKRTIDPTLWDAASESYEYFNRQAKDLGLRRDTFIACDAIKLAWRKANANIANSWRIIEDAGKAVMLEGGEATVLKNIRISRTTNWLVIQLPSGRKLTYCQPQLAGDNSALFTYMGVIQTTRKWQRMGTYGAKLCIAKDTLVLCKRGWVPIQNVTKSDEVYDGVEWVTQEGAINNGCKKVIEAYGVYMTPDHLVLTTEGWKNAEETKRFKRYECRLPENIELHGNERTQDFMECSLHGMQRMARIVRGILCGHGANLQTWTFAGSHRCEQGVLQKELPMAPTGRASEQSAKFQANRWDLNRTMVSNYENSELGSTLPPGAQLPTRAFVRQAQRNEQVYDLVNCGPRHRFVVLGSEGPVIVHNCENIVQAISCDLLCHALVNLEAHGYAPITSIHDEVLCEVPDTDEYTELRMEEIMTSAPDWAAGLPLNAAGFEAYRYRKD